MNSIGFDVHKTSVLMVALNDRGKITHCREYPTTEKNVIKLVTMVPGPRQVMFEEGGMAGWMKMVVEPYADKVVVCDPTQNRLISKADFNDGKGLRGYSSADVDRRPQQAAPTDSHTTCRIARRQRPPASSARRLAVCRGGRSPNRYNEALLIRLAASRAPTATRLYEAPSGTPEGQKAPRTLTRRPFLRQGHTPP